MGGVGGVAGGGCLGFGLEWVGGDHAVFDGVFVETVEDDGAGDYVWFDLVLFHDGEAV